MHRIILGLGLLFALACASSEHAHRLDCNIPAGDATEIKTAYRNEALRPGSAQENVLGNIHGRENVVCLREQVLGK